jgi:tryptophan-rich sensory protein
MKNSNLERWATAAFVIGSIISTYFFSGPRRRGSSTKLFDEQQRQLDQNLTTPANVTFAIVWPVIYTGTIALALHQALPSQMANTRYAQARPWWVVNYMLNIVFGYFFSRPNKASRVAASLTTITLLPTAIGLHQSLEMGRIQVAQPEKILLRSVSLYAGWLTVATVVSVGNLLIEAGLAPRHYLATRWAMGILPITVILGLIMSRKLNDPYYLVPFVAAFSGIGAKQYGKTNRVAALSYTCAFMTAIAFTHQLQKPSVQTVQTTKLEGS